MEIHSKLLEQANLNLKNADHMLYVTYPLINDPKLTISIIEKLYNIVMDAISAILNYDYLFKRIEYLPEKPGDKLALFKEDTIKRYNLNREILILIQELKEFVDFRKKSPIEIVRKENFIVFNSRYNTKTINIRKIKYYVGDIKLFMNKINKIVKNGF